MIQIFGLLLWTTVLTSARFIYPFESIIPRRNDVINQNRYNYALKYGVPIDLEVEVPYRKWISSRRLYPNRYQFSLEQPNIYRGKRSADPTLHKSSQAKLIRHKRAMRTIPFPPVGPAVPPPMQYPMLPPYPFWRSAFPLFPTGIRSNTINHYATFTTNSGWNNVNPNPTSINQVPSALTGREPSSSKPEVGLGRIVPRPDVDTQTGVSPIGKLALENPVPKKTGNLPSWTQQSSRWMWPNGDVTGPLYHANSANVEKTPSSPFGLIVPNDKSPNSISGL